MDSGIIAQRIVIGAFGINQPLLVVFRALFQISQRDAIFTLTIALGDATMTRLWTGI
jgi:hypothetical protein